MSSSESVRDFVPFAVAAYADLVGSGEVDATSLNLEAAFNTAYMAEFEWKSRPVVWHLAALGVMDLTLDRVRTLPAKERQQMFNIMQTVSHRIVESALSGGAIL